MNWRAKTSSSYHTIVKKPTEHYMHCLLHGFFYYRYFGIPQRPNIRVKTHSPPCDRAVLFLSQEYSTQRVLPQYCFCLGC